MGSPIKNVAVVGGSGNLGRAVVSELVDAGFTVTVLTREGSTATFPAGVVSKAVDYSSVESLTPALEGQDALVSTIATVAVAGQQPLVDAAVAAGVRRIIPSEFGINTRFLGKEPIGTILQGKVKTLNYIHEKSKQNPSFTWTGISTGLFFDWGLEHGSIGLDKATKTATIYDSGNEPYQASNLPHIGKAIAALLKRPEVTTNRYITIASFNPTQNQVLEIAEKITGEKWTINQLSTSEQQQIGVEKLSKGDYSAFSNLLRKRVYGDGAGLAVQGPDNALDLLGLEEDDLEGSLRAWLTK
ncbi:hypothetical protein GQX73_g8459 [Xylaria multiplex]|uniref:NmrA-like domain-containing protein n=1 Tax=Xylaria multiplex TaxID=323545 RepID=A0A7C8IJE1_9PEZI|nr:hypothetical protein GQX73_g8459 [Xylaria multiplex]